MGVDISDILVKHSTNLKDQGGMRVSVDAYNIIYQFLSSIRQPDGTPLMDRSGNVTSHLSGLFYRTINMIEVGIKPAFVFDGRPSVLKNRTLEARKLVREKNREELRVALEEGNEERARSLSSRINYITAEIVSESKDLLKYMGVPVVQAPSEGEAQASVMCRTALVDGVVSQDYDCLLFGARRVFRNLTQMGKRKLPGKNIYVNVTPEYIDLQENLGILGITWEQLIHVGIMVGTDFNSGLPRTGAKSALKLIKKYGTIQETLKARKEEIENLDEIIELFMNPPYADPGDISMRPPDAESLKHFLCDIHDFSPSRVDPYIETLQAAYRKESQKNLDSFF